MLLNYACGRETGLVDPQTWNRAEVTRRVFNIDLSKYRNFQKIHATAVRCLDIDPVEGRYLLSGSLDGVIVVYDLENPSGSPSYTHPMICTVGHSNPHCHKHSIETIQWYPLDTGMFTSSGTDQTLKVWDTNTLVAADTFNFPEKVNCHDLSPVSVSHNLIAVGTNKSQAHLIDLRTGSATHILREHREAILTVRWSTSHEHVLATGSQDNKVMLWDIRSAKGSLLILDQYNGEDYASSNSVSTAHNGAVNGIMFTSDGLHLVTVGTDCRMRLWNSVSGRNMMVNYGRLDNDSKTCVKFSLSSSSEPEAIFIQDFDSTNINMYDMWSGSKVRSLEGHYSQVNVVVYHPEYQELYSAGADRNMLVWMPQTGQEMAYDDYLSDLNTDKNTKRTKVNFTSRVAMQDAWSSDED